jgi:isocitrate dehydrogenase kinase/phosphatase
MANAQQIAERILAGFDRHYALFRQITAGARQRFERADWQAAQGASRERIEYYDQRVVETVAALRADLNDRSLDEGLLIEVKMTYVGLLHDHCQPELAESFYNSVFCRLFHRRYYNNRNIFVRPAVSTEHMDLERPAHRCFYPGRDGFRKIVSELLTGFDFTLPFEDPRRDLSNVLRTVREHFHAQDSRRQNLQLQVLNAPFFRNKGAYLVGKLINGSDETPFAIALMNNEKGGLYVDAVMTGVDEIANIFSFSRAYFMIDTELPAAVVEFLACMLPGKTKADLYTAIGLQKHGKTEFYRDFLYHLKVSEDALVQAPGIRGMVMTVFTLPSYPYVFKVIKDRFAPPKEMTRDEVKQKYRLVKLHDRAGRMADSWEFSEACFPLSRFSPELLAELKQEASSSVEHDGDHLVIKHLYIERRMTPLNIYLKKADATVRRRVIRGYGNALRELAAADIFPGDMLLKNFGVTRQGRVVFYDYDEISYLTQCNFRRIPEAPYPEFELSEEPWYSVSPNDLFPEEWATFLFPDPELRRVFFDEHADLMEPEFWIEQQARIRTGRIEDVFPYPSDRRFPRRRRPLPRAEPADPQAPDPQAPVWPRAANAGTLPLSA